MDERNLPILSLQVLMITICFWSGNYVTDDVCTFQVLAEQHEKNSIEDRLSSEIDQLRLVRECVCEGTGSDLVVLIQCSLLTNAIVKELCVESEAHMQRLYQK